MWTKIKNEFEQGKTFLQFGFLQTLGSATIMLVPLLVAKFFSESLFGQYSLGETIIYFFLALFITSARIPFIVYANQERVQSGRISKTFSVWLILVATGFVLFTIICLFFHKMLMNFAGLDRRQFLCVAAAFVGLSAKDMLSNLYMSLNQRIKSAFTEMFFGSITVTIVILLHFSGLISFKTVLLAYFVSSIILYLVGIWFIDFKTISPLVFDKQHFSKMFKFMLWMVLGVMAAYLIDWGGIAILRKYVSIEDTGTFNLGYKFFKGFMVLIYILPNYFLPHISESINNPAKIRFYLYHKRLMIFLLGVICSIAAFFVLPLFINFVYGDKYQNAVPVVRILLMAVIAFIYTSFYGPIFGAMERYKFVQIAVISQSILNIGLNLVLIPRMDTYGAAIATVSSYIYLLLLYEGYFRLKLAKIIIPKQK